MKLGRNDVCSCGSGKKYKKCCLSAEIKKQTEDLSYARLRSTESKLVTRLMDHVVQKFGQDFIDMAWTEFTNYGEFDESTMDDPMDELFVPWLLFNWSVDHRQDLPSIGIPLSTTVAEDFINTNKSSISSDESAILESANRRPYTFCEVIESQPGAGLVLKDLFQKKQFEIIEKTGSKTLNAGDIILCATMLPLEGRLLNIGTGPVMLPPTMKAHIFEMRQDILDYYGRKRFSEKLLRMEEPNIIGFYLDIVHDLFNPSLNVSNTDGESVVFHKVVFDLTCPPREAQKKLRDLSHPVPGGHNCDDHKKEQIDESLPIRFPWIEPNTNSDCSCGTVLGDVEIKHSSLSIQVNSEERAEKAIREINERLGNQATYKITLVESIESKLEEIADNPNHTSLPQTGHSMSEIPEEILESMAEYNRQHWIRWLDQEIPALKGLTPRKAASTVEGRDLLKSLFYYYEQQNEKATDNFLKVDIETLKKNLGLL